MDQQNISIDIRPAASHQLDVIVALATPHFRGAPADLRRLFEESFARDDALMVVAEADREVVGFGLVGHFQAGPDASEDVVPDGYYLSGVAVTDGWKRRGVASQLVHRRLEWVASRTDEAFSIVDADNTPSLAMHAKLGYERATHSFSRDGESRRPQQLLRIGLG